MQKHKLGRWGLELISIFDLVRLTDSKQVTMGKTGSCIKNRYASVLHKDTWCVANTFHTPFVPWFWKHRKVLQKYNVINLTASKCFACTCYWREMTVCLCESYLVHPDITQRLAPKHLPPTCLVHLQTPPHGLMLFDSLS